jgi:hypothetical protein
MSVRQCRCRGRKGFLAMIVQKKRSGGGILGMHLRSRSWMLAEEKVKLGRPGYADTIGSLQLRLNDRRLRDWNSTASLQHE